MSEIKNECVIETIIRKSGLPELLIAAQALVEAVEGPHSIVKSHFRDSPEWLTFYDAVENAEDHSKTDAPPTKEAAMKSIERLELDTLTQTVETQGREILKAFEFIESLGRDLNTRMLKIERAQPSPYAPPDPPPGHAVSDDEAWLRAWCAGINAAFVSQEVATIIGDVCLKDFRERSRKDGK